MILVDPCGLFLGRVAHAVAPQLPPVAESLRPSASLLLAAPSAWARASQTWAGGAFFPLVGRGDKHDFSDLG